MLGIHEEGSFVLSAKVCRGDVQLGVYVCVQGWTLPIAAHV